jgi:hypothetical protein
VEANGKLRFRHLPWCAYLLWQKARLCRLRCTHLLPGYAAAVAVCVLIGFPGTNGQSVRASEYDVKAAYLFNFSRFVEWPPKTAETANDSFAICVLGRDPFGPALNATIARESIAGKNVVAKQILSPQDAEHCRVLFISASEDRRLKQIFEVLGTASILTVSDLPRFTERGGMVQFVLAENRVRFEVNSAITERAGLTLSSELLKVAVNVRTSIPVGD